MDEGRLAIVWGCKGGCVGGLEVDGACVSMPLDIDSDSTCHVYGGMRCHVRYKQ